MPEIGQTISHFKIVEKIGQGGMGEVYLADDTTLDRKIALKFLLEAFTSDPERMARFEREAKLLASLNHPNIAGIHGLEQANGNRLLVLEYVEGETLQARLSKGALPLEDALALCRQIAEGLEAAHEKGVIHRDLKPTNVMITAEEKVKILDFGLAKALSDETQSIDSSQSPTLTEAMTRPGVILGTAAYMSPEQGKGKAVDKRADIWAFGCILYECLTGKKVFEGETVTETLASVLKNEPDWSALPESIPPNIRFVLRRCLEKNINQRFRDAADVRIEIDEALAASPAPTAIEIKNRKRLTWMSLTVLFALIALALSIVLLRLPRAAPEQPEIIVDIDTPPSSSPDSIALSPDGRKIVFTAESSGRELLWLRSLDSSAAQPLTGTDNAYSPFWSPDSRSVAFFADGQLKRVDTESGSVQFVAGAINGFGGTWGPDGTILFAPNVARGLFQVSATGGEAKAVIPVAAGQQMSYQHPQFLPDGRHFLFLVLAGAPGTHGVYIGQLDSERSQIHRVIEADAFAYHAQSQELLFVVQGKLYAQRFDPVQFSVSGSPSRVADQVSTVSSSSAGPILYRTLSAASRMRQLTWLDRSGKPVGIVGDPDPATFSPMLSSDGRRVAVGRMVNSNPDIWLLDTARGMPSRLTSNEGLDLFPIWSPDGRRIAFESYQTAPGDIYIKQASGAGAEQLLVHTDQFNFPTDWSPDGRYVLFRSSDLTMSGFDIWAVPVTGDRKPFPVVQTKFDERDGQFSPDGHWIAYQSNESGRFEIYLRPFPGPGANVRISKDGGAQVRWHPDGSELFFIAFDGRLMSVPIRFGSGAEAVEPGSPVPLFATRVGPAVVRIQSQEYAVSRDGQRFLMNVLTENPSAAPLHLILNWKPRY